MTTDYQSRKAARIERLRSRASNLQAAGIARVEHARQLSAMIPMGQPILVGHHSEKRHRRDLARIHNGFEHGFALQTQATALEARADRAESNSSISSDDPSAIAQLRAKLESETQLLESYRNARKDFRKASTDRDRAAVLVSVNLTFDILGGFPSWAITNLSANIRRIEQRIASLEAARTAEPVAPSTIGAVEIRTENNRTQIQFPSKPSEVIRSALKSHGFRWAPSVEAWQRMASTQAQYWAEQIAKAYNEEQ